MLNNFKHYNAPSLSGFPNVMAKILNSVSLNEESFPIFFFFFCIQVRPPFGLVILEEAALVFSLPSLSVSCKVPSFTLFKVL